jgi:hypothetical protein
MSHETQTDRDRAPEEAPAGYEPPRVESVLSSADLEQEICQAAAPSDVDGTL